MIGLIAARPADYAALAAGAGLDGWHLPEGGLEPQAVLEMLAKWSARVQAVQGWSHWFAVEGREIVASLGVKDPINADGAVEIGYGVAPLRRGAGRGTAALAALLPVLRAQDVRVVLAEVGQDNAASVRVLQKNGFAQTGTRLDVEDGPLTLWRLDLTQGQEMGAGRTV